MASPSSFSFPYLGLFSKFCSSEVVEICTQHQHSRKELNPSGICQQAALCIQGSKEESSSLCISLCPMQNMCVPRRERERHSKQRGRKQGEETFVKDCCKTQRGELLCWVNMRTFSFSWLTFEGIFSQDLQLF